MRDEDDEQMRRQCRSLPSLHSLSGISKLSGANIALDTIPEKNNKNITMVQKQQRIPHKAQTISAIQSEQKEPQKI